MSERQIKESQKSEYNMDKENRNADGWLGAT